MKMEFQKLIKREDGSRILISVSLYVDIRGHRYDYSLQKCEPKKRSWPPCKKDQVTGEEIEEAMLGLWQKIKPLNPEGNG